MTNQEAQKAKNDRSPSVKENWFSQCRGRHINVEQNQYGGWGMDATFLGTVNESFGDPS